MAQMTKPWDNGPLRVSENHRYFQNGTAPFLWIGDTAWLLFQKLDLDEAYRYLKNRKDKQFNVIQCVLIHHAGMKNVHGSPALVDDDFLKPDLEHDYWEHADRIIDMAADLGLYMGILPIWGSMAKQFPNVEAAASYAAFVANRYKDRPNIISVSYTHLDVYKRQVVYTAAIHPDNPEFRKAQEMNLPMLTRAQLLGQIMRNYDMPVAVAGTHGKTTTTSMLSHILLKGDCDPTISVGGILPAIGGNIRVGQSETFLTEACEYTNSFLSFFPKISIILNIDADHLDFFKDIEDIRCSFRKFAELLPEDGTLIINADTPQYEKITEGLSCQVLTYSLEHEADYTASDITYNELGHATFTVCYKGQALGTCSLSVPDVYKRQVQGV